MCVHSPPITSWKCGTRRPLTLRLTPRKPRSATWCCPQELKQPLVLMCSPASASSWSRPDAASSRRSSAASARDDEIPSLQVSVPGQAVMSLMVPAPGSASCAAFRAA